MSARTPSKQAGFTLIEMLVALFIFSLISAGSVLALTTSLRGKTQMESRLSTLEQLSTARVLIRADMDNLILRPRRDRLGSVEPDMLDGGVDSLLRFTRVGRQNPGGIERRGDLQRVSYHFEDGALIRRTLAQVNPAPNMGTSDRVLIVGLVDADITFFREDQRTAQKQIDIPLDGDAPLTAIRLRLEFENTDILIQDFEVRL